MSEFDKENIVVPQCLETAVYTNEDFDIVIRQKHWNNEEDQVVILPRLFVDGVILRMRSLLDDPS